MLTPWPEALPLLHDHRTELTVLLRKAPPARLLFA